MMRIALAWVLLAGVAAAEVKIEKLPAQTAIATTVRAKPAELAAAMQKAMLDLLTSARDVEIAGPPFARYLSRGETYVVEAAIPIKPPTRPTKLRTIKLPAGSAAVVVHTGSHAKLLAAHAELDAWLASNRRAAAGPRFEVYLTNPITTPDPNAQVTRVYAPLAD